MLEAGLNSLSALWAKRLRPSDSRRTCTPASAPTSSGDSRISLNSIPRFRARGSSSVARATWEVVKAHSARAPDTNKERSGVIIETLTGPTTQAAREVTIGWSPQPWKARFRVDRSVCLTKMASALEREIGKLLVGGFEGSSVDPEFARLAQRARVGGAILFRRNLGSLPQVRDLTDDLHGLGPEDPLSVSIDQEGGRVQRLRQPFPELPPMRTIGTTRRKSLAHLAGRVLGLALRTMGIDQNYAPVLDVDSNPDNPVIGDRAFSSDPHLVSRLGAAFIDGLQEMGVAACGKHFPGHGDTDLDSHLALPRLPHTLERLREVELPPFRAAARAGVAAMMSAHVLFPEIDPNHPATLSEKVLRTLVREEIRFDGVIVSDDLEMKAITLNYGLEEAAVLAIAAGCDQILICKHPELLERAFEAIKAAVMEGRLSESKICESAERVRRLNASYVRVEPSPSDLVQALPHALHQELMDEIGFQTHPTGADPTEGAGA